MLDKFKFYFLPTAILAAMLGMVVIDLSGSFSTTNKTEAGCLALKNGNSIMAIRDFSSAVKFCETDIQAHAFLGTAYQNYGWNDEALKEYRNAWLLASQNASFAMLNTARISAARKDYDMAVEAYRRFLFFQPDSAETWYELGQVMMSFGKSEDALAAFNQALKIQSRATIGTK